MTGVTISPGDWPSAMQGLSAQEAVFAVWRAREATLSEAWLASGGAASNAREANRFGDKLQRKPKVSAAIAALRRHHQRQHGETLRYA